MRNFSPLLLFLSLSTFAQGSLFLEEADISLTNNELQNEIYYDLNEIKLKNIKYLRTYDNKLLVPKSSRFDEMSVRELQIEEEIDSVILDSNSGFELDRDFGVISEENLERVMLEARRLTGGEGGT